MKPILSKLFQKLLSYFLQGIFVLTPLCITIFIIIWVFNVADNILPSFVHAIAPNLIQTDAAGHLKFIPGLGITVTLILIIVFGYFSSFFIVDKFMHLIDSLLEKTPGIKVVYTTAKDIITAFKGGNNRFNKPVLVSIENEDIYRIGFITQKSNEIFNLPNHVTVYVPLSYAISGMTYIVPKERIKYLPDNITSGEAMKFAVSGGLTDVD
ncbi:MAG: DUF502 domain-containing protein [Sediminibacterium sp.]|nr:DUF502 domain-containing protein [Sediminibacterium sp.]